MARLTSSLVLNVTYADPLDKPAGVVSISTDTTSP
jgi:hypothetical protein